MISGQLCVAVAALQAPAPCMGEACRWFGSAFGNGLKIWIVFLGSIDGDSRGLLQIEERASLLISLLDAMTFGQLATNGGRNKQCAFERL